MFCFQCQETTNGTGCDVRGVCGKQPDVADLEDLLVFALKGLSARAFQAARVGIVIEEVDHFVLKALFTTVTNVNFDPESLQEYLLKTKALRDLVEETMIAAGHELLLGGPAVRWQPAKDLDGLLLQAASIGLDNRFQRVSEDIASLQELLTYGLKGMAAYAFHALMLGYSDPTVNAFTHEAMAYLSRLQQSPERLQELCFKCGEVNVATMALLDQAHTDSYGHPTPTQVRTTPIKGKAILVSGHDLKDLQALLEQTEGLGINIYTHSEMLPAHGYPELNKYKHLAGNYGGAWHTQVKEFDAFPGPILMTSNCIQKPKKTYIDRLFTAGPVHWPGTTHIDGYDFSAVIEKAQEADGFLEDAPEVYTTVGFGHNAVLGLADTVLGKVAEGAIKHFFVVGGCDGRTKDRSYYTEFTKAVPDDCVVMTLGCAKYRFIDQDFGDIDGIPRYLDLGQCNDAFSAVRIAQGLADALGTGINDLPLSLNISWYEQKAVCILLSLLHLGVRNIHLGPTLPAFLSPGVAKLLVEQFALSGIGTPQGDLDNFLASPAS